MRNRVMLLLNFLIFLSLAAGPVRAEVTMQTKNWGEGDPAVSAVTNDLAAASVLNLLCNAELKVEQDVAPGAKWNLCDQSAGVYGGDGRVALWGTPSRLVYYLGRPWPISAVCAFAANIDSRANLDFEVRFANNAEKPGEMPAFPEVANLTTGDTIVGADKGVFSVSFENADKSPIATADWVEFRFWRTYPSKAGDPGKGNTAATGWCSLVELQVLVDPNNDNAFPDEQSRQAWLAGIRQNRLQGMLQGLDSDLEIAIKRRESLKLAIEDMHEKYPDELEDNDWLARWKDLDSRLTAAFAPSLTDSNIDDVLALVKEYDAFRREVLLANPVLDFDKVLIRKTQNDALMPNWISNVSRGKGEYNDSLVTLDIHDPDAPLTEVARGNKKSFIGDIALHWDADRCLVTSLSDKNTWQVFECNLNDGSLRQVTPEMGDDVNNAEGCYVPDGSTIFISSASMMGVPCIAGTDVVGNVYRLEPDGQTVRQLTFEQDQDWCPVLLENGRILYLRWEYIDISHYFTRILMTMNPDGTNQVEHYGSGSFWPNSMFYAKPIPGQSSRFVTIVSGHHGIARSGEMVVFDPSKGRQEDQGVVQRIMDRGKKVEPIIADQLVAESWPQFLFPAPLSDDYFLATAKIRPSDSWDVYLVDTFDNILRLKKEPGFALLEATPLIERDEPRIIPDRTVPGEKEASYFITNVNFGQGLPGVPAGTVKKLRLYALSYGYRGTGGHDVFGMESCWDARRILGEVPVFDDGSATFKIPANTPVVVQPLDETGSAMQLMRSWFVGMPGETGSCIGCHETQNSVSPVHVTEAQKTQPMAIEEFYGPERPFAFETEVQPVLDKFCVGCHNGEKPERPNFADNSEGPRRFSKSYHALHPYVRRPGPESEVHVLKPMEYHSSTSELIKMLRKGHHNVQLDQEAWQKLICWIDLNVPYFGTWIELSHRLPEATPWGMLSVEQTDAVANRHVELKKLYANNDLNFESGVSTGSPRPEFIPPEEKPDPDLTSPNPNWGFDAEKAKSMTSELLQVPVAAGLTIQLAHIPAGSFVMGDDCGFADEAPRAEVTIEKPFWIMTTEVTNALFHAYDAEHDSRYIDQWNKDHTTPGYPANLPNMPVIRISWQEAMNFCKWLSEKTGRTFRLPTEAEWEWAARAGSAKPMWFGDLDANFGPFENLADESVHKFVVAGINPQPVDHQDWEAFIPHAAGVDDGHMMVCDVAQYQANPWGLYDMLGNVAEWTLSDYAPLPYKGDDGRNAGNLDAKKVAKGGSWRDRPKWGRAGVRGEYESWQKVFNVGFRVVCEE
ncbi:MAG: SUMF1/EgtB/PvdO family nonheme iron enzyme [Planctomycetia bacterium]|nr:SUMF1/EgtB/PvdO family nonheme iron enzyme [Planctomycetia bacterium]